MKKKPKPRRWPKDQNVVALAMEHACIITKRRNDQFLLIELDCIASLRSGHFSNQQWNMLISLVNISEVMAKAGVGIEVVEPAKRAEIALAQIRARYQMTAEWRARPEEVDAISELHQYHNLQRTSITYGEYCKHVTKAEHLRVGGAALTYEEILRENGL